LANKTQAKAAIDAAVTSIKADIDNILPVGVDITDGSITFNPTRWGFKLNATTQAAADTLATSIETALTAAARPWTETRGGKRSDDGAVGKFTQIGTTLATYTIKGFV
jgi:hypothetical protein